MAKKIEVVISANEQASNKIKGFNKTLATTQKIADATGSSYDRMSALSNRLQLNTLRLADAQRRLAAETDPMKQAQLRVEIDNLAHSQDALQKEIHESSDAMGKMGDSSQGVKVLGLSLTDLRSGIQMVTGAARTMAQVTKAAFDFTEEGASVIQTRESFERLGVSIEAMREVSLNTIDDMTLMKATLTLTAGASEELQAELLDNAPALLKIAKAANAVNPGLGTTAQMYESISTGIKRSSPLILDNLGIVVKIDAANRAYAKTLGIAVEEMTAADKQMALLNATIEAGDRLIEQAGGSVESYGDAWAQLRVEIKNTSDEIKAQSAEALGPLIRNYIKFLKLRTESGRFLIGLEEQFRGLNLVLAGNERAMDRVDITWKLATLQFQDASDLMQRLEDDIAGITVKEEQSGKATKDSTEYLRRLNEERKIEINRLERMAGLRNNHNILTSSATGFQKKLTAESRLATKAWDQYSDALERNEEMLGNVAEEQTRLREAEGRAREVRLLKNQAAATQIAAAVRSQLTKKLEEGARTLADLRREQRAVNEEIERLTASHGRAIITQSKATMTAAEASLVTLQLADAQKRLSEETDPLKQAQLAVRIENLQEKLGGASEATTTFVNNTKKIDDLKGKYSELAGEIDGVNKAIGETVKNFMIAQIQSTFALDGWTDAEVKVFTDTAVAFGFMDEQHAKLISRIHKVDELIDEKGETEEEAMANTGRATNMLLADQRRVTWEYTRMGVEGTTAIDSLEGPTDRETERMKLLFLETEANVGEFETLGINAPLDLQKVEIAAGHAVEQLHEIRNKAVDAQDAIDDMEGKSITVDIHINTHGKGAFAGLEGATSPRDIIEQQHGGDYMVTKPTMFIAGEGATPERALFIPQGRKGFDGAVASQAFGNNMGPSIGEVNIFVNGTADAHETARLVMQEFKGRGLMPQTPLR